MKKHTKLYFDHFDIWYDPQTGEHQHINCEVCNSTAVDINHIDCRGMGGSKLKDSINNLIAQCRECHLKYGDKKQYNEMLIQVHQEKLKQYV